MLNAWKLAEKIGHRDGLPEYDAEDAASEAILEALTLGREPTPRDLQRAVWRVKKREWRRKKREAPLSAIPRHREPVDLATIEVAAFYEAIARLLDKWQGQGTKGKGPPNAWDWLHLWYDRGEPVLRAAYADYLWQLRRAGVDRRACARAPAERDFQKFRGRLMRAFRSTWAWIGEEGEPRRRPVPFGLGEWWPTD